MKRFLISVLISTLLFMNINAAPGNNARLDAMGGVSITVPDMETVIDSYSLGFTSAYVLRERKSFLFLSPELGGRIIETPNDGYRDRNNEAIIYGIDEPSNNAQSGAAIWFEGMNVFLLRPYYHEKNGTIGMYDFMSGGTLESGFSSRYIGLVGEYAQGITDNLALGLLFGWSRFEYIVDYDNSGALSVLAFDKIHIDISGTYFADIEDGRFSVSLSLGNSGNIIPLFRTELFYEDVYWFETPLLADLFEAEDSSYDTDGDPVHVTDFSVSEFIYTVGADLIKDKLIELSGKIGITPDVNARRKYSDYTDGALNYSNESDTYVNGLSIFESLIARIYIGDMAVIGLSVERVDSTAEKYYTEDSDRITKGGNMRLIGGFALTEPDGLTIPIEYVFENMYWVETEDPSENWQEFRSNTVRGGVEYAFDNGFAVRAGLSYSFGGHMQTYALDGEVYSGSETYGTEDFPEKGSIAVSGGTGYKAENFEVNLSFRQENMYLDPMPDYYNSYKFIFFNAMADIKVFF